MYSYAPDRAAANTPVRTSYFYGLNRLRKGSRGEFESMKNMSGREYPCAAPRGERKKICTVENMSAAVAPDATDTDEITGFTGIAYKAYTDDDTYTDDADEELYYKFYYNGKVKSGKFKLSAKYEWSIIRLGNLYVINGYSDGSSVMYYYNIDTGVFDLARNAMDNLIVCAGNDEEGSYLKTVNYGHDEIYNYEFENEDGDVIRNSDFFSEYCDGAAVLPEDNIFERVFEIGDEVSISGFPTKTPNNGELWQYSGTKGVEPQKLINVSRNNTVDTDLYVDLHDVEPGVICVATVKSFKVNSTSISGATRYEHYIYFNLADKDGEPTDFSDMGPDNTHNATYCTGVTVSKRTRIFSHIATHLNRIWGTSPTGNRIYASNSNDPFAFMSGDIILNEAARVEFDTEGTFTALCEYGGDLLAFKETSLSVLYGNNVYSIQHGGVETIHGIGCIDGRSVAVTPQGVIFLSYDGFYIYNGTAAPTRLSEKLNRAYVSAVGGWDGTLYYAAACSKAGDKELLVYDTARGTWHIHDDFAAEAFFRFRGGFYMAGGGGLFRQTDDPGTVEWEFTTVKATDGTLDNKAVNEIWILCDMAEGAYMKIWTSVDNGEFVMHRAFAEPGLNVIRCPIRAINGVFYRYRITGAGGVVFYDIEIRKAESEGRDHTEKAISPVLPVTY